VKSLDSVERSLIRASRIEARGSRASCRFWPRPRRPTPFIGLFGTVWGIMGAFGNIGATGSTSITAVAPASARR
jgi:biopolymer transport protein TolQ